MVKYNALRNLYELEKTIGTGGFAKVKLATHLLTGEKVAIKIMNKNVIGDDCSRIQMELEALRSISHQHICKLYQVIETDEYFFFIMEYCSGGELFDHIVEKSQLTEFEARLFFRQILSAVAYLHKVGFAHRDLKPENILLDKDMNLKIIDFGLCAKPKGGMSSHLQTSCGSPTYAAPELIKGIEYLGAHVDVWSLGVLLYALMCGRLPFDCDNIENLYKKILAGRYSEPSCLSEGSRKIIREMLQTDPKKRITIDQLLSHEWVTMGCLDPVIYKSVCKDREKNSEVLNTLAEYHMMGADEFWEKISKWEYDYDTATYLLLTNRQKQGMPLKLCSQPRVRYRLKRVPTAIQEILKENETPESPVRHTYNLLKEAIQVKEEEENKEAKTPTGRKRKRSNVQGADDASPIPVKMTPGKKNVARSVLASQSPSTPTNPSTSTPGSKLLCSIERKLNKVRQVITPRKRNNQPEIVQPCVLQRKGLCNVSTTTFKDPDVALEELKSALKKSGVDCKNKGFLIKGKINGSNKDYRLKFELEICYIQSSTDTTEPVIGIRRKRLKGDSWCYKKVCEEILKLTSMEKSL